MQLNMFDTPLAPGQQLPAPPPSLPSARARSGEELKREGMAKAAESKAGLVAIAREIAIDVARGVLPDAHGRVAADGTCTMDDVMANWPEGIPTLGNAAGQVFQWCGWRWNGELVKSVRPESHQNLLRVWRREHA